MKIRKVCFPPYDYVKSVGANQKEHSGHQEPKNPVNDWQGRVKDIADSMNSRPRSKILGCFHEKRLFVPHPGVR